MSRASASFGSASPGRNPLAFRFPLSAFRFWLSSLTPFEQQVHETLGLGGVNLALPTHYAVSADGKEFSGRDDFEFLFSGNADADDDGDAEVEFDVFLNYLPAADLHGDLIGDAMLFEGVVDHSPGAEVARG